MQAGKIWNYAEYRFAGFALQPLHAGLQQTNVAAKAIDHETAHALPLGRRQAFERTEEMREHAAAVDVGHQDHRAIDRFGKTHVGDVALAQVDFRRAAGV